MLGIFVSLTFFKGFDSSRGCAYIAEAPESFTSTGWVHFALTREVFC